MDTFGKVVIWQTRFFGAESARYSEPLIGVYTLFSRGGGSFTAEDLTVFSSHRALDKPLIEGRFFKKQTGFIHPFVIISRDLPYSAWEDCLVGNTIKETLNMPHILSPFNVEGIVEYPNYLASNKEFFSSASLLINERVHAIAMNYAERLAVSKHNLIKTINDKISGIEHRIENTEEYRKLQREYASMDAQAQIRFNS